MGDATTSIQPAPANFAATLQWGDTVTTDALARLYDGCYERLFRLSRRLTGERESALDLVQETFLRAARHLGRLPVDPREAEAWLVRTLVNASHDLDRRRRVRGRQEEPSPDQPSTESGPDQRTIARRTVATALAKLPARRRAVVVLHELEEHSVGEIAQALGIARVTVRWHLAAGLAQLGRDLGVDEPSSRQQPGTLARSRGSSASSAVRKDQRTP